MCKAHSKVIENSINIFITSSVVDIKHSSYYIHGSWRDEFFLLCCICYFAMGLTHCYKRTVFYIYWHVTLELTICEIFAVKWQKSVSERPIMVNRNPFLDPWTEVIATKRGETTSGTSLTSCKISRQSVTHRRRDICPRTKNTENRRYQAGNTNKQTNGWTASMRMALWLSRAARLFSTVRRKKVLHQVLLLLLNEYY